MKYNDTILKLYRELYNTPEKWKYYPWFDEKKYTLESILDDGGVAIQFIQDYFQCGEKTKIVEDIARYCKKERASHSISTFFLGILLFPLFAKRSPSANILNDKRFLWIWFLTCLYHDIGYKFEENRTLRPSLNTFVSDQNVQYKIFGNRSIRLKGITKKTVRAYYRYRLMEHGCVDHGIVGGILLYDSLRKNYATICQSCNGGNEHESFTWHGLNFSESHFQEYEKCANAIIQHNLWFNENGKDGYEKYIEYHLDELTFPSDKKPRYKDWLTALLVFCDTIEPIKRFSSCKSSSILQKIRFKFDDQEAILKICFTDTCMNAVPYTNIVIGMADWSRLSVTSDGGDLTISHINEMYQ